MPALQRIAAVVPHALTSSPTLSRGVSFRTRFALRPALHKRIGLGCNATQYLRKLIPPVIQRCHFKIISRPPIKNPPKRVFRDLLRSGAYAGLRLVNPSPANAIPRSDSVEGKGIEVGGMGRS